MADGEKIKVLAVVGPTASGKTSLSVTLAEHLDGEIVSCDSMQVYRRMNIGTAKPTMEERHAIAHHLIDVAEPETPFSAADYITLARNAVKNIDNRGKKAIFCGGTGLYWDRFLHGGFEDTMSDPALRKSILDYAAQNGVHALHERLRAVDPESAAAIHENNVKRVARALEIFETTGMTKTEADRRTQTAVPMYDALTIGLHYRHREVLYAKIRTRVEQMMSDGLIEETRRLEAEGVFARNATAAQAIGYKELLPYLHGEESLEAVTERLVIATRQYAKRQLTWFRAKEYVHWIEMERDGELRPQQEVTAEVLRLAEAHFQRDKIV